MKYWKFRPSYLIIVVLLSCTVIWSPGIMGPSPNTQLHPKDRFTRSWVSPVRWTTGQVVSTESTQMSLRPSVAIDGSNNTLIVWEDVTPTFGGSDWDIVYKIWNSTSLSWSSTMLLSNGSNLNSHAPEITGDDTGNLHVVWYDHSNILSSQGDWDIFYRLWNYSTGSWGRTEVVSTESSDDSTWVSVTARNGEAFVAWQDISNYASAQSDPDIFYKMRQANGTWTTTEVVSTESSLTSRFPAISVTPDSHVYLSWDDLTAYGGSASDLDVFFKWKNATTGVWSTTEVISNDSTSASERSKIAVDAQNNRHIIWFDSTDYMSADTDRDIFYRFWNHSLGMWMKTEVVSTESTASSEVPSMDTDDLGNLHVVWFDTTDIDGSGTDQDVIYKLWNATNLTWDSPTVISTGSNHDSWRPKIIIDARQTLHIVWSDRTNNYGGSGSDVDILYSTGSGLIPVTELTLIQSPNDLVYVVSATGNVLVWTLVDDNVSNPTYSISRNGSLLLNQSWIPNSPIQHNVDNLEVGAYNYTLQATDGWGNFVNHEVIVTVISQPTTDPENPFLLILVNMGWGVVVALSMLGISFLYVRRAE